MILGVAFHIKMRSSRTCKCTLFLIWGSRDTKNIVSLSRSHCQEMKLLLVFLTPWYRFLWPQSVKCYHLPTVGCEIILSRILFIKHLNSFSSSRDSKNWCILPILFSVVITLQCPWDIFLSNSLNISSSSQFAILYIKVLFIYKFIWLYNPSYCHHDAP